MNPRIKLIDDKTVSIAVDESWRNLARIIVYNQSVEIHMSHSWVWDAEGRAALCKVLNCFDATGNFAALSDESAVPFVGKRVRLAHYVGEHTIELIKDDELAKDKQYLCFQDNSPVGVYVSRVHILPLSPPKPKVRPYTPKEAVEYLGRKIKDSEDRVYLLQQVAMKYVLIGGDKDYTTYERLAEEYVWADTGEPCGVVEE